MWHLRESEKERGWQDCPLETSENPVWPKGRAPLLSSGLNSRTGQQGSPDFSSPEIRAGFLFTNTNAGEMGLYLPHVRRRRNPASLGFKSPSLPLCVPSAACALFENGVLGVGAQRPQSGL